VSLPTLPFSKKFSIVATVQSASYNLTHGIACIVDYAGHCLSVQANALGWGPVAGPFSKVIPLTSGEKLFAVLTVDATVAPYAVNVSVNGGAPVAANPSNLKAALLGKSFIGNVNAADAPFSNIQEVSIFPYVLSPSQIQALATAWGP